MPDRLHHLLPLLKITPTRALGNDETPRRASEKTVEDVLESNLERIVLRSDGAIQLRCGQLGEIDLGRNIALLNRQIDAIQQLSLNLPKAVISGEKALIDLSNPDRPEIQLPAKATS